MAASAVPERENVTSSEYVAAWMHAVSRGSAVSAACWMVRQGASALPGLSSLPSGATWWVQVSGVGSGGALSSTVGLAAAAVVEVRVGCAVSAASVVTVGAAASSSSPTPQAASSREAAITAATSTAHRHRDLIAHLL